MKGPRKRCKTDTVLLLQLYAAGRDDRTRLPAVSTSCSRAFCRQQSTKNTLAPFSCSSLPFALWLDPSFTPVHETALFWGDFDAVFQDPKGRSIMKSQAAGVSDILPLDICNNANQFACFVTLSLMPQGVS